MSQSEGATPNSYSTPTPIGKVKYVLPRNPSPFGRPLQDLPGERSLGPRRDRLDLGHRLGGRREVLEPGLGDQDAATREKPSQASDLSLSLPTSTMRAGQKRGGSLVLDAHAADVPEALEDGGVDKGRVLVRREEELVEVDSEGFTLISTSCHSGSEGGTDPGSTVTTKSFSRGTRRRRKRRSGSGDLPSGRPPASWT